MSNFLLAQAMQFFGITNVVCCVSNKIMLAANTGDKDGVTRRTGFHKNMVHEIVMLAMSKKCVAYVSEKLPV